jgi:hypothetical protein
MITADQLRTLHIYPGQIIYQADRSNADYSPRRWKVNGQIKFWKTRPSEFRIPVKNGMYGFGYITDKNAHLFFLIEEDAIIWRQERGMKIKKES